MVPQASGWPAAEDVVEAAIARSTLAGVRPIGLGTAMAESEAGYLIRLGWCHDLSPSRFMRHVLVPALGIDLGAPDGATRWGSFFSALLTNPRPSLNGRDIYAALFADLLARLTGREEVRRINLTCLAAVLPAKDLLRAERAFCRACLARFGDQPYEPLLWQFRSIEMCVEHGLRLETACPNDACQRSRPILATWAQPGLCEACPADLAGAHAAQEREPMDADYLGWQRFVAEQLGNLVAALPTLSPPATSQHLAPAIATCLSRTTDDNLSEFARRIRMALSTVSLWKDGRRIPTLDAALRIARVSGVELLDLLLGNMAALSSATGAPATAPWVPPSRERHRWIDWPAVEEAMKEAIVSDDPPALYKLLRTFGIDPRHAKKRLPQLSDQVRDRHSEHRKRTIARCRAWRRRIVRKIIAELAHAGIYPSRHQVQRRCPPGVHLRDPDLHDFWLTELERHGYVPQNPR